MVEGKNSPFGDNLTPELRLHMEKTIAALKESLVRRTVLKPDSPGHPEQLKIMGKLWHSIREAHSLGLREAAASIGIPWQDLDLFEGGLLDPKDYKPGLIEELSKVYGVPEMVEAHENLFGYKRKKGK